MGKKTSSSQPSTADPQSPSFEAPRMDPPPPYDTVARSPRSSISSSVRSVDRLDPDATGTVDRNRDQGHNAGGDATGGDSVAAGRNGGVRYVARKAKGKKCDANKHSDGGCSELFAAVEG
jgi:hypothetical protein